MRKKTTAGVFALLFGPMGLHRFYLGQKSLGLLYFGATIFLFALSVNEQAPIVLIMALVCFIDAMLFFSMPKEEFDEKHNRQYLQKQTFGTTAQPLQKRRIKYDGTSTMDPAKAQGIEKFKDYDFEGAVEDFKNALSKKYDDPAVHFNLACCYSLLEKPDPAFFHLSKAVQFGFVDFDKIEKHDGLAYLRTLPEYRDFVKNGYQRISALPSPAGDLLSQIPASKVQPEENLLEQINRLSELRKQGILTEEEFMIQTKRVLGN